MEASKGAQAAKRCAGWIGSNERSVHSYRKQFWQPTGHHVAFRDVVIFLAPHKAAEHTGEFYRGKLAYSSR
jgi:hypothetical protein